MTVQPRPFGRAWRFVKTNGDARSAVPATRKYGNKKVLGYDLAGKEIMLDSKREARRWGELCHLFRLGHIEQLERQVVYHFQLPDGQYLTSVKSNRKRKYILDFRYIDKRTGELVHEDAKGHPTPEYELKRDLMMLFHGVEVLEV